MTKSAKARKPIFEEGDRVGFWASREKGTVRFVWWDEANEMVTVKWDGGTVTEERAYKLAHAS